MTLSCKEDSSIHFFISASNFVKEIYVSTDSEEIAEISLRYVALVPRLRSKLLSTDRSTSIDTALDFSEYFSNLNKVYNSATILCLPRL